MDYNLLICTSKERWVAVDVTGEGVCDRIGFDGNEEVAITSMEDVAYFCSQIQNYYNVESFTDIPFHVKIVVVGEYSELVIGLFEKVQQSKNVNIIDAKNLIPLYVLKNCIVKPGGIIDVECLGETFTLSVDDNYVVTFGGEKAGQSISITPEDFSLLFRFECRNLLSDEKEKKELQEEIEKLQKELLGQKKEYEKLQAKLKKLEGEYEKLEKGINDAEMALNEKRRVLWFEKAQIKMPERTTGFFGSLMSAYDGFSGETKYKCRLLKKNGDIVSKGLHLVAVIECRVSGANAVIETGEKSIIKAPADGRVFYLVKDNEMLDDSTAVALMSEASDTKEALMKWYNEMK